MAAALVLTIVEQGYAQSQWSQPQAGTPEQSQFQLTPSQSPRQRPTRQSSSGQSLGLTANVLRGYDDNVSAALGFGAGTVPLAPTSGSTGYADAMLEYSRKTSRRSILVRALGDLTMYPDFLDRPAPGAKVRFVGVTPLGPKNSLTVSTQIRYEPLFTPSLPVDADGTSAVDVVKVTAPPTTGGLFQRQSWVTSSKAYLTREWSQRDTTVVSYLNFTNRYSNNGGSNDYQQADVDYGRRIGRAVSLHGSYGRTSGHYTDLNGLSLPTTEDTLAGGPSFTGRRGRRRLSASFHGGATFLTAVDTVTGLPYDGWKPYAKAAAAIDLTSAWRASGDYERSYSVMQGLAGQIYAADATNVTVAGHVRRRTEVSMGARFANGRTMITSGSIDTFSLYGGGLQVRFALTSRMAATAEYFRYYQRYSNPAVLPKGFPAHFDRDSFHVGLTFWSRLAGTLPTTPRGPREW